MWNGPLRRTIQPSHAWESLDFEIPIPGYIYDVPDQWLESLADEVTRLFFSETDEDFDRMLEDLRSCEVGMFVEDAIDPLGIYIPKDRMIKIDQNKIQRCTENMKAQGASVTFDQLSKIIEIHEDKHALHHLAEDSRNNNAIWDSFGNQFSYVLEMLAQLFTFHDLSSDGPLLNAFIELERRQPVVYHLWRLFKKCPKEELYWAIRDSDKSVIRIIRILERAGLASSVNVQNDVWQVAAGDTNRNFADLCLDWDVIMNGPGSYGPWDKCRDALLEQKYSARKVTDIERFCEHIQDGDIIILHVGTKQVWGVGIVVGEYLWEKEFDDIDGWDLQHIRRVRWIWKYNSTDAKALPQEFPAYSLNFGDTTQKISSGRVINWIRTIPLTPQILKRTIKSLPESSTGEISMDGIAEYLFAKGVGSASIARLTDEINELIRIAKWYDGRETPNPSEAETVSYLVIPLLRALGWTPQKMAIEWNYVDIALFKSLPRRDETLLAVVEAKPKGFSCLNARTQAHNFTLKPERGGCTRLIVTDGIRYGIYLRKSGQEFGKYPDAYLNLTQMRESYPILHPSGECSGAKEAFFRMSADWDKE